jgi:hypothetical protein
MSIITKLPHTIAILVKCDHGATNILLAILVKYDHGANNILLGNGSIT